MAKYIKLLMVALFATMTFALTSCGDDDDEPSTANIVGTWKISAGASVDLGIKQYVQFKKNGGCTEVDIDEDSITIMEGSWELRGSTLLMTNHDEELGIDIPTESEVWKLTDSELVLVTLGFKQTYKKVADSEIEKYL